MLGFHRQRRIVQRRHGVPTVPGSEESWEHRGHGTDGAENYEIFLDAGQHERFPPIIRGRTVSFVEVKLHLRQ